MAAAALSRGSRADDIVAHLRLLGSETSRQGMARYGIRIERALGIPRGVQRRVAKAIGKDHERAFQLWDSGISEAQFIASLTADPKRFTAQDARSWAASFDSWDIVDGVSDLFAETPCWRDLIASFAADDREFVRRAAFATMAWAVVRHKKEPEETFLDFLPLIEAHACDQRNFVRKAVNWALRAIGKRSPALHRPAVHLAEKLAASSDKTARWIGRDALRELTGAKVMEHMGRTAARAATMR